MELNNKKVLLAIDCIIKDVDKKYDECLVDKFLQHIEEGIQKEFILDRLNYYIGHKDFVMLNQTRVYQVFSSAALGRHPFSRVRSYFDALWSTLDTIVLNNNLNAITALLKLLSHVTREKGASGWLIERKIEPPIKVVTPAYEMRDLIDFVRYYIEHCNNYHTKNAAERVLVALIEMVSSLGLATDHPVIAAIRKIVADLIKETSILIILEKVINDKHVESTFSFGLILQEHFDTLMVQPMYCRLLPVVELPHKFGIVLEKFESKNRLDALIVYLAHLRHKDPATAKISSFYLLYPILSTCDCDDARTLELELSGPEKSREFIERNMDSRTVTLCLDQLKYMYTDKQIQLDLDCSDIDALQVFNTLICYIRCHYSEMKSFKNVFGCCNVLSLLEAARSPQSILKTIDMIDCDADYTKQILMKLIRLLRSPKGQQIQTSIAAIELAFRYLDHDIMNEFALLFCHNGFDYKMDRPKVGRYVELIWNHMYRNASETDHRELQGTLTRLLVDIDFEVDAATLESHNIRRHHDIPNIIADILTERAAVIPTIEKVVEVLESPCVVSDLGNIRDNETLDYVGRLDSPNLPNTVRKGLDRLTYGLCITIQGESSEANRRSALRIIDGLVREIVVNCDSEEVILERLIRIGVLETLHKVITCILYSQDIQNDAMKTLEFIRSFVISKVKNAQEIIDKDGQQQVMADFYTQDSEYKRDFNGDRLKILQNEPPLSSFVDDILNYSLLTDGISDCY